MILGNFFILRLPEGKYRKVFVEAMHHNHLEKGGCYPQDDSRLAV